MSAMASSGFVGVSTQIAFVSGRTAARTAVCVPRNDDVVAGTADRTDEGVLGGHPGGEGQPARAALERGEALFERGAGRIGAAAVLKAAAQPPDAVLLVGRDLVDRRHDRTR